MAWIWCLWGTVAAWSGAAIEQKMVEDALVHLPSSLALLKPGMVVAVTAFEYPQGFEAKNVEEKVVKVLTRGGRLRVTDRRALEALLKEQALSMSGLTEPASMKSVGGLLNAEAFVFGKITVADDRVVINLEMREVATGAVMWSEELVGENPDQISFGLGVRVGTFGASSQTYVTGGGLKEYANLQSNDQGSYIAFMGHYVQRFGWTKAFSFGADATFSRGDWNVRRANDDVLGGAYHLNQTTTFRDWNLTLIPLLRFHPAYLFGMKGDVLVLYGGVGFSGDYFGAEGTFQLKKNDGTSDTGELKYNRVDLYPGNIAWKVGAEMRLTQQLSMFLEAYRLPGVTAKFEDVSASVAPEVSVKTGLYYGFGVKYYGLNF